MTDLALLDLPADDADWRDWLTDRVESELAAARAALDTLKDGSRRAAPAVLELWNDGDVALGNAASVAGLLAEVHPDAEVRALAEELARRTDRAATDRALDRELYDVLVATDPSELGTDPHTGVDADTDTDTDAEAVRLRDRVLRDFRRAGVDRDEADRARLREIAERLTAVDQDFARAIREDVRTIRVAPERLAGLPDDWIAGHPAGADGLVAVTTDYPDAIPVRTFAHDAGVRTELTHAFLDRGWPANDAVLHEMLGLRDEQARLVGYPDWPSYDADVKMTGSSARIAEFLAGISEAARDVGSCERDMLLARRQRDEPAATDIDATCTAYYSELVRRENFDLDAQEARRYFAFEKVRQGLLEVTGRLFGIEYVAVPDAASWHPDVAVHDVVLDGVRRGRIHLDLHPREGKYKHAAQFDLVTGVRGRQLPEGALVCNFPRGLMQHTDVVTLFHEFGHLVHHVLGGDQRFARFSGVATEWDFVEAPSQLLEEWARDTDVLQTFATDDAGTPIPAELVERMRRADDFGKGLWVRSQSFYAAVAYELYRDRPADLTERVRELQGRYDVNRFLEGTHFHASFGHLAGYTSAYYTYLWSLVIAKDLFARFDRDDLLAAGVAHRYRDGILAPGGSRDAADLVTGFLGRPFTFDAFASWLQGAPVT